MFIDMINRKRCTRSMYDRVVLTTLGSRVLGYLELYLHLRREQMQIPLQTLTSYNHREHIIPNCPIKSDLSI